MGMSFVSNLALNFTTKGAGLRACISALKTNSLELERGNNQHFRLLADNDL
jgi:hypothetical protein